MIKAYLSTQILIIGVEKRNIDLLENRLPMRIDLSDLPSSPHTVLVFYGDTLEDCRRHIMEFTNLELPPIDLGDTNERLC